MMYDIIRKLIQRKKLSNEKFKKLLNWTKNIEKRLTREQQIDFTYLITELVITKEGD